ncbi:MAG: heavy-metal-associated domain-containing protein [Chitinophagaceae bacterium]
MKNIFFLIAILISVSTKAQVTNVYLQASGLACSMCSSSINKALKTLDFIDKIDSDIKNYTLETSCKTNSNVDFDKIKKKVEDAGFSVSGFVATIYFKNVQVRDNEPITIGSNALLFVNLKDRSLNGAKQVKPLDKGFISSSKYKKGSFPISSPGIYHATI